QLKSQNKHFKKIRDLQECDQIKKIQTIINNPPILLDYLIPKFLQLNDNDFSILIKKILESRKMNTFVQKQLLLLDYLISSFEHINDDNFNSMIKKIVESREMDAGAQKKCNDIIICACNLPEEQLFNVLSLFQTMTYSQGINKEEIISTYLQNKARDFIDASLYQQGRTIIVLKLENKNLIQEN
ncbi:1240_t:CDS:1, partial [Cetraspora pellucida]